jgi:nitroreductase
MTSFLELAANRQSDRGYLDKPVEKEKIMRCLEAVRIAPSACNAQPWKFIIVDQPELKNSIAEATTTKMLSMNHFTRQAPVMAVVVMEKPNFTSKMGELIRDKTFTLIDVGIATEHFCLQAAQEGLGTCIMGWFNEKKVKSLLNIPKSRRALLIITLGYRSNEIIRPKIRKELSEIYAFNQYEASDVSGKSV